jgi:LysR family nitrogen assimilation transcriptional regulator
MIVEDLHFVVNANRAGVQQADGGITLEEVARHGLFLPEQIHTLRQAVEAGFASKGLKLRLVGEVESVPSLARLLRADLGATIMPKSAADALFHEEDFQVLRIVDPALQCKIALCTPDHDPLSEAASAVLLVVKEMLQEMLSSTYSR